MEYCKGCNSSELVKNGRSKEGGQRYKCKFCGKTFCLGDRRLKYKLETRLKTIKMYLEGMGIRSIERITGIPNPLIIYWIRHFGELVRKEMRRTSLPKDVKDIEILEIDELFTYYKKNPEKHMYGLLLTETGIKLLISR